MLFCAVGKSGQAQQHIWYDTSLANDYCIVWDWSLAVVLNSSCSWEPGDVPHDIGTCLIYHLHGRVEHWAVASAGTCMSTG